MCSTSTATTTYALADPRPSPAYLWPGHASRAATFENPSASLGGDFGFDPAANRMVMVNVGMLREALSKVYHAHRIADELAK